MCREGKSLPASEAKEKGFNRFSDAVINLDNGDPTLFEPYWRRMGDKCDIEIRACQSLSYFANLNNSCWFLEPKLEQGIKRLHQVVGNAQVKDHHIVVGTGSSQLVQAVLYALSSLDFADTISVIAAVPYYSSYKDMTEILQSGLFKWAGDARTFNTDEPYIELITSPNNPDGFTREPVVKKNNGKFVYDLAYYWPQYTPITSALNHDVMLFTLSKCTGHAGSRIGWALVKDRDVAKKMIKFIELNTIGVAKESQLRAAKIIEVVCDSCQNFNFGDFNFFEHAKALMVERWRNLRDVMKFSKVLRLPDYPRQYCQFSEKWTQAHPAFAWVESENMEDCENLFRQFKILTRCGRRFQTDPKFVRISMLSRDDEFNIFLHRLSAIHGITSGI